MYPIRVLLRAGCVLAIVFAFTALVFPGGPGGFVIFAILLGSSVLLGWLSRKVRF